MVSCVICGSKILFLGANGFNCLNGHSSKIYKNTQKPPEKNEDEKVKTITGDNFSFYMKEISGILEMCLIRLERIESKLNEKNECVLSSLLKNKNDER